MVSVLGVSDLVVVETDDAVLVAHKDEAQRVKQIVDHLDAARRTEHVSHRASTVRGATTKASTPATVSRSSASWSSRARSCRLQMHHHRAEHWVVVSGTAKVTRGDEVKLVAENESTYIPIGMNHRLENPGKVPLHLIEVQSGSYLGEDDIVRFEDIYQRS